MIITRLWGFGLDNVRHDWTGQGLTISGWALERPPPPQNGVRSPVGTVCCVLHITQQLYKNYKAKLSTPTAHKQNLVPPPPTKFS
jgi:hypothetical protein